MAGRAGAGRAAAAVLGAVVAAVVVSGCASAGGTRSEGATIRPAVLPSTASGLFVAGYHPYWTADAWASYPFDLLDELYFFEIEIAGDGRVLDGRGWPESWRAMSAAARSEGVQVVPTVSMHDAEAFQSLFLDAARVAGLVDTVLGLLEGRDDLAGLHLDFEVFQPVDPGARDGFTAFVARLVGEMRVRFPGRSLSVFTLAFDDDDAYDERTLGQVADFLVVQGYDYHSANSPTAGPIGALRGWGRLNLEHVIERFEGFGVPRDKLVLSLPVYGYEWPVVSDEMGAEARGEGLFIPYVAAPDVLPDLPRARDQASRHGVRRDPVSGSPYYVYERADGPMQGWFEDAESLRAKVQYAREAGVGGIALFPLAYGDGALWQAVREGLGRGR